MTRGSKRGGELKPGAGRPGGPPAWASAAAGFFFSAGAVFFAGGGAALLFHSWEIARETGWPAGRAGGGTAGLAALTVALECADIRLTRRFLERGRREGNPVVRMLLAAWGAKAFGLKAAAALVRAAAAVVHHPLAPVLWTGYLGALAAFLTALAAWNWYVAGPRRAGGAEDAG